MTEVCVACRAPRAKLECGICKEPLCKACDQLRYERLDELPAEVRVTHACSACFTNTIEPAVAAEADLLARAQEMRVFTTNQRAALPILKRSRESISITDQVDRDQATLDLAIQALRLGFNALVETEIVAKKARNEGYQKMLWNITAVPALLDADQMARREARGD